MQWLRDSIFETIATVASAALIGVGVWAVSLWRRINTNQAVIDEVKKDIARRDEERQVLLADVKGMRSDMTDVRERIARIEGRLEK